MIAIKYPIKVNKQKLRSQNLSMKLSLFFIHDLLINCIIVLMFMRLQIVKPNSNQMDLMIIKFSPRLIICLDLDI